ncbi:MAG: FG-GAP-like repeat-containing protein [Bacteroidota bacterium]
MSNIEHLTKTPQPKNYNDRKNRNRYWAVFFSWVMIASLLAHPAIAAFVPVITSFSPTSGPVGTSVTITGEGLNQTPSQNSVFFGPVQATVTSTTNGTITVTVPPGATFDYISVTNMPDRMTGYSAKPFIVTYSGAFSFKPKFDVQNLAGTTAVNNCDLDGDGKPDLITNNINSGGNTISILLNTSSGGVLSFGTKQDFTTAVFPTSICTGDLNADGKADIVVASQVTITVFMNTSSAIGTVSFDKADYPAGGSLQFVAIGNIDPDGKPDIITCGQNANTGASFVSVFRNTTTTFFNLTFATKVDFTTGGSPYGIGIGDIDKDGNIDVVTCNASSSTISVLRNKSTIGTIDFFGKVDFATGANPIGISVGDLDADGKIDIVTGNTSSSNISILHNSSVSGTINFDAKIDISTGDGPAGVAINDINGDGKPDVAVCTQGLTAITMLRNTTIGNSISFAAKIDLPTSSTRKFVALCDMDGDGKTDIVSPFGNGISIFRQLTPLLVSGFSPASGAVGSSVVITGTGFNSTAAQNVVYFGAVKATVTSASTTSLTVTVPNSTTYKNISVVNRGENATAFSAKPFIVTHAGSLSFDPKTTITTGVSGAPTVVGDLDGDGKPDLVVANSGANKLSIFRNTSVSPAASFASAIDLTGVTGPTSIAVADLDGDGKTDICANNSGFGVFTYLNNSSPGTMNFVTAGAIGMTGTGFIVADMDGDGKPDFIVVNNAANTITIARNTSVPGTISTTMPVSYTTGSAPRSVAVSDVDADGRPDLVVANSGSANISVLKNTSTLGTISIAGKVDFTTGSAPYFVATGDIDGDGKPDVVVANNGSNTISVLRNTTTIAGTPSFAGKSDFATGAGPQSVVLGDVDGDGKPDVATGNNGASTISVLRNISSSGTPGFAGKSDMSTGVGPNTIDIIDMDGDGKPDLLTGNPGDGTASFIRQVAPVTITAVSPASGAVGSTVVITGTGFSITGSENIVYFGAVKAAVTLASNTSLSVTVPNGTTFQNITVTNTALNLTAYSTKPFIVTRSGDIAFRSKVDFGTGTTPRNIVLADIDGEGRPDIIETNFDAGSISVFRNTSVPGTFSKADSVNFYTGNYPAHISMGDLDGDGKTDLVVTNEIKSLSVLRNTSPVGGISFAPKTDYPLSISPVSSAVGDLDGDGKPDIAFVSNNLSVMLNTTTGGTISFGTAVSFTTGSLPRGLCFADIDGDGKDDVILVNANDDNLSVMRNLSTPGNLSFAPTVSVTTGDSPVSLGIADLDGDGKLDIAVVNSSSNNISIFRNNSSSGNIAFHPRSDRAGATNHIAFGDINGDGKPDMVLSGPSPNVTVLRNISTSGTIGFASGIDFVTGSYPICSVMADMDGDTKPDLTVANFSSNSISILRQVTPLVVNSFTPASGIVGTSVTITGSGFNSTMNQNVVHFGSAKATVTGITATSITVNVPPASTYQNISVTNITDNLTAYTSRPFTITPQGNISFALKTDFATAWAPRSVSIDDLDNDGRPDLAAAMSNNGTISLLMNASSSGTPAFAAGVNGVTGQGPYASCFADLDGSGELDMVVVNNIDNTVGLFRNVPTTGSISLEQNTTYATGAGPNSVAYADFDGDNKIDLATANSNATVSVLRNTTVGIVLGVAGKIDFATGTSPQSVVAADIDGDGKPDLVVANSGSNTISVLRNISTYGVMNFAAKVDIAVGSSPLSVCISDVDGDGKPDIVVANSGSNTVSVLRNNSNSGTITLIPKVDFTTAATPRSVSMSDIDGDGKPDLAVAAAGDNKASVLRNNSFSGTIAFDTKLDFTTATSPFGINIADIDGDGRPDLVVANNGSNSISVLKQVLVPTITSFSPASGAIGSSVVLTGKGFNATLNQNVVFFGPVKAAVTGVTSTTLTVTIPNGANYNNISVTNLATGLTAHSATPFAITLSGSFSFDVPAEFTGGTYLNSIASGDIDGDGKADIVTGYSTGTFVSLFRNVSVPGTVSFSGKMDITTGSTSEDVKLADINSDGKPDLLVTNSILGTLAVYRNTTTGSTFSFATPVLLTTGNGPSSVTVRDFDGDGKPDLGVSNSSQSFFVSIFRNTSVGTTISFDTRIDLTTPSPPQVVVTGDVNGDGKPDLISLNTGNRTVSVFRNISTYGAPAFAAKVDFSVGNFARFLSIGDLDGDGKAELVVSNTGSQNVSLLRNTSANGIISFESSTLSTGALAPNDVAIGDVDGDGKPDLSVMTSGGSVFNLFRNLSTPGTINFALPVDLDFGGAIAVVFGDIDNDGKPDLAVGSFGGNMSVLRQVCPNATRPVLSSSSANNTNCGTRNTTLSIASGTLNNATNWQWYTGGCGGTSVGSGTSITVSPAVTTTYYARGEGSCAGRGPCASITITVKLVTPVKVIATVNNICPGSPTTLSATRDMGNAVSFDGINDYIHVPSPAAIPTGNSSYTMEAWIKPNTMGTRGIIGFGKYGTMNEVNAVRLTDNGISHYWWSNDLTISTGNLTGQWHHVAVTFDGFNREIYLDGIGIAHDQPNNGTHNVPATDSLTIGVTNRTEFFDGQMDEVRIWNIVRTDPEIKAGLKGSVPTNSPGLISYFKMDEVAGNTITNAITGGANGTLKNSPTRVIPAIVPYVNASFNWMPGNLTGSSVMVSPTGNATYTVAVTDSNGCTLPGTIAITTKAPPVATIGGAVAVCPNTTAPFVSFTGSGSAPPYTFTYNVNGGASKTVGTATRYIRIQQNKTGSHDNITIAELEALDAVTGENRAAGKVVTMSSVYESFIGAYLTDGNINTFAHTSVGGTGAYMEVDLGADFNIGSVRITNRVDCCPITVENVQLILKDNSNQVQYSAPINGYQNQPPGFSTTWPITTLKAYVAAPANVAGNFSYNLISVASGGCSQIESGTSLITVASTGVPAAFTSVQQTITGTQPVTFGTCEALAVVQPQGASPVSGLVITKIWVEATQPSYNSRPYLKRHVEIAPPAAIAATATGRITLYATQPEMDAFNAFPYNGLDLPSYPTDNAGIANIRIFKYNGTSSNGTGTPDTYTQPGIEIDPVNSDISWNSTANRWEISFNVTGFSGFFIGNAGSTILPLQLLSFNGSRQAGFNQLTWSTANETNTKNFELESSIDGRSFAKIAAISAVGSGSNNYSHKDVLVYKTAVFYRLKMVDADGKFTYSSIVRINHSTSQQITIYPNPATILVQVEVGNSLLNTMAALYNAAGKLIRNVLITANLQRIDVHSLSNGVYTVRFENGTAAKFIVQH